MPSGESATSAGAMPTGIAAIWVNGAFPAVSRRGTNTADATTSSPNTAIAPSRTHRPRPLLRARGRVIASVASGSGRAASASGRGGAGRTSGRGGGVGARRMRTV